MRNSEASILVADVGGTKIVFALAAEINNTMQLTDVQTFASGNFDEFRSVLDTYLSSIENRPTSAVFAVAGPILDGQTKITNLPWQLDEQAISVEFELENVRLINDLESMAWSIPALADNDVVVLQKGSRVSGAPMVLIAPGTGLGEAFLTQNRASYVAYASEGSHADFAPCDEEQDQLLGHLRGEFGHVSVERVCSGIGMANIYRFLIQEREEPETPSVQTRIEEANDITPIIIAAALSKESLVCERAVCIFVDSLAVEAGNFALKTLATGGVFLGGGIPMRILPFLQSRAFIDRFASKGRFSEFLRRVPVAILRDPLSALRGAAIYGLRVETSLHDEGRRA